MLHKAKEWKQQSGLDSWPQEIILAGYFSYTWTLFFHGSIILLYSLIPRGLYNIYRVQSTILFMYIYYYVKKYPHSVMWEKPGGKREKIYICLHTRKPITLHWCQITATAMKCSLKNATNVGFKTCSLINFAQGR